MKEDGDAVDEGGDGVLAGLALMSLTSHRPEAHAEHQDGGERAGRHDGLGEGRRTKDTAAAL